MHVGQIVQLKSGSPNLTVDWEIGVTPNPPGSPIDANLALKTQSGYDDFDNSCVWTRRNKQQTKVFPVESLTVVPYNPLPTTNQTLTLGCVVQEVGQTQHMTVNWVIGTNCRPVKTFDIDKILVSQGFQNGDVSCLWFDAAGNVQEQPFRANQLIKIYD